jgi:ABC-type polar amino acid transport system ATPase subunit
MAKRNPMNPIGVASSLPNGTAVADFASYPEAVAYVERILRGNFPATAIAIVGSDLSTVERIRGRINYGKVARSGAMTGSWLGLLIFLVVGTAPDSTTAAATPLFTLPSAILVGAGFGMLFQGAALFDSLTVWENVSFALVQGRGMKRKLAKEIAIAKLAKVGLSPDVAMLRPSELSGGMQKRVGLARAIAADPEVIFFDEPTTGLDPIMADVINELIVELVKDLGATALSITHDMGSVRKIADNVAMIYEGKIIWDGPVADIDNSGNPYVDQFVHGRADGPIKMTVAR